MPEASSRDPHPSSTNPQPIDPSSPSTSSHHSDSDWSIVIKKDTCSTRNPYLIYNFLSYHHLSPSYVSFVFSLSSLTIPSNVHEALDHLG